MATSTISAPSAIDLNHPNLKTVRSRQPGDALSPSQLEWAKNPNRPTSLSASKRGGKICDTKRGNEPRPPRQERDMGFADSGLVVFPDRSVRCERERNAESVAIESEQSFRSSTIDCKSREGLNRHNEAPF